MTGIIDWAADRARMIIAFITMSVVIGVFAYVACPKRANPISKSRSWWSPSRFPAFPRKTVKNCSSNRWKASCRTWMG